MSRTIRGKKPPGYEFWSRRPGGEYSFGPYAKKLTHRAERNEAKKELKNLKESVDKVVVS